MSKKSTFNYFAIAGIIGSFNIVNDKGWVYLIPFWIIIFIISKVADWIISKWDSNNNVDK